MTNALAVKFGKEQERFRFNEESLGAPSSEVLHLATARYAIEPVCTAGKVGAVMVKKAIIVKSCVFSSLQNVLFAGQKVIEARYQFINGRFEQLDLEIEALTSDSMEALLEELTVSFDVEMEVEGPVSRWSGDKDTAMLVRQGNYKLHMTNNVYMPRDVDYTKLTPRK